jgi:hypothetical protein
MASETSVATESTRDVATQVAASAAGGIAAHMAGDWWQHNETNKVDLPWTITPSEAPSDEAHTQHTIENSCWLRLLITANGTNYGVYIPAIDSGVFVSTGTWSGSPTATAPSFTVQPPSTAIALGDQAVVECTVIGTPPILIRWTKDGIPVTGATSTSLFFSNFSESDVGNYVCIATNANGQTLSEIATIAIQSTTGEAVPTRPY